MTTLTHNFSMPEKAVEHGDGSITGRCPACALSGGDRTGNHLRIYPDHTVHCIVDKEHWREIRRLLGMSNDWQPHEWTAEEKREWAARKRAEEEKRAARARTAHAKERNWKAFVDEWRWDAYDLWESSVRFADGAERCPKFFLQCLFPADAVIWTGETFQSGISRKTGKPLGEGRFRTVAQWGESDCIGPMVAACTFPADMPTWPVNKLSRSKENVATAPYVVLDFDGENHWEPQNQAEIDRHITESLAVTNWLRSKYHWRLAAIVNTGRKSLHCWFSHPGAECVEKLKEDRDFLCGIDKSLLDDPSHPARLPGQVHSKAMPWDKDGKEPHGVSTLLWMSYPNF